MRTLQGLKGQPQTQGTVALMLRILGWAQAWEASGKLLRDSWPQVALEEVLVWELDVTACFATSSLCELGPQILYL